MNTLTLGELYRRLNDSDLGETSRAEIEAEIERRVKAEFIKRGGNDHD